MTPERWRDIERVFHRALAAAPDARAAVIAEACSTDEALRQEVESLLAQADSSGMLDGSAAGLVAELTSPALSGPLPRRLGLFELQELLGVGGMGEVYRARDTRLGRDVAIKILPLAFRNDSHRAARFEQEARVLASLNHPHIASIYGLEEAAGVTALVMELVEGNDLSARPTGRVDQALEIARQIAEALEAAHERGIIHRDLKPANIKVRPDGTVKVLDFGLATAFGPAADPARILAEQRTLPGAILGTPAYMSPEQARGEPASPQADVWAFGAVLYELLTGVSPFGRPTTSETFVSVLREQPDYSRLPLETPPSVRRLIRRCLEKERKRRLQHVGDARIELDEALSPSTADASPVLELRATRANRNARGMRAAAVGAAFAVGLGTGALFMARRPAPSPVLRTIVPADILVSTTERSFAFTPDGSSLAYVSSDATELFVRPLGALEPSAILKTPAYMRGLYPSPDGQWFAFIQDNFALRKIPATGGAPGTIVMMDGPSRGAAWGPHDTIVFATGAPDTGLQRVASDGGPVTVLTRPDPTRDELDHVQPVWLPDGRGVLFTILSVQGGLDAAKVAILDLATGKTRVILEGGYGARYVHSGHLVYAAAGALWAIRFDLSRLVTEGAPVEVLRSVIIERTGAAADFDISRDGTLIYSRGAISDRHLVPVWVDRGGREIPLPAPAGAYRHPRLSPDGKRLAVVPRREGQGDLYIWEVARPWSSAVRVTVTPGNDWFPVWTPDGRSIVFGSWRGGRFSNLYIQDLESGSTRRLTDSRDMQLPTSISPDGTTVIFHSFTKSLQALRLDSPKEPIAVVETPGEERNGVLSPDGRWLAYEGDSHSNPGQLDVFVRPFPDTNRGVWQVTEDGGTFPVWSRTGRELFYVALDGTMVAVPVEASGTAWKAGSRTRLFRGSYEIREDGSLGRQYDVAPDGRFLMLKREAGGEAPHFVIVQNWVAELARRLR